MRHTKVIKIGRKIVERVSWLIFGGRAVIGWKRATKGVDGRNKTIFEKELSIFERKNERTSGVFS